MKPVSQMTDYSAADTFNNDLTKDQFNMTKNMTLQFSEYSKLGAKWSPKKKQTGRIWDSTMEQESSSLHAVLEQTLQQEHNMNLPDEGQMQELYV